MKRRSTLVRIMTARWVIVAVIFGMFATAKGVAAPTSSTASAPNATAAAAAAYSANNMQAARIAHRQQLLRDESDSRGRPRPDLWRAGIRAQERLRITRTWGRKGAAIPAAWCGCAHWVQVGPAPLRILNNQIVNGAGPNSGEVVDMAIDPTGNTDSTIYIATNDGGIWRTRNRGVSWVPTTDNLASLSMGAVALDPTNASVVYAGTGNQFDGAHSFSSPPFSKGVGIYRSTNGGDTWPQLLGASVFTGKNIIRIVVPNSQTLLVATYQGLYKSVDAGAHFGVGPDYTNGKPIIPWPITDLRLATGSPTTTTVFAALQGLGILKSTDLFTNNKNLTNVFAPANGAPKAGTYSRVMFAQADLSATGLPKRQTLYVSLENRPSGSQAWGGLYKTTTGGSKWTKMPAIGVSFGRPNDMYGGCQCDYDMTVGVDPRMPNLVYLGFQDMYRSTDGGANFAPVSRYQMHVDHHALVFSPHSRKNHLTRLWVGEDGGVATSQDGLNWANLNEGLGTLLFNGIDIGRGSTANNRYTYGGSQDNGLSEDRPEFPFTDWQSGQSGDGAAVAVDPSDPQRAYGAINGQFDETSDGGMSWDVDSVRKVNGKYVPPLVLPEGAFRFGLPMSPHAPGTSGTLFVGSARTYSDAAGFHVDGFRPGSALYRSVNDGQSFAKIATFDADLGIWAIAVAPSDPNTVWVGFGAPLDNADKGYVYVTHNALAATPTWLKSDMGNPPNCGTGGPCAHPKGARVTGIAVDPTDPNSAVVTYSRYCDCPAGQKTRHVFRVKDNGTTLSNWDISGTTGGSQNLPDLPVHAVVIDPTTWPHSIIVANDAGVLRSVDNGATWQRLGSGLPTVDSTSLALDYNAHVPVLRVGTYGRSTFELQSG